MFAILQWMNSKEGKAFRTHDLIIVKRPTRWKPKPSGWGLNGKFRWLNYAHSKINFCMKLRLFKVSIHYHKTKKNNLSQKYAKDFDFEKKETPAFYKILLWKVFELPRLWDWGCQAVKGFIPTLKLVEVKILALIAWDQPLSFVTRPLHLHFTKVTFMFGKVSWTKTFKKTKPNY